MLFTSDKIFFTYGPPPGYLLLQKLPLSENARFVHIWKRPVLVHFSAFWSFSMHALGLYLFYSVIALHVGLLWAYCEWTAKTETETEGGRPFPGQASFIAGLHRRWVWPTVAGCWAAGGWACRPREHLRVTR